jgi:hypothetical protein
MHMFCAKKVRYSYTMASPTEFSLTAPNAAKMIPKFRLVLPTRYLEHWDDYTIRHSNLKGVPTVLRISELRQ